jgi:hypothetical protein
LAGYSQTCSPATFAIPLGFRSAAAITYEVSELGARDFVTPQPERRGNPDTMLGGFVGQTGNVPARLVRGSSLFKKLGDIQFGACATGCPLMR